VPGQEIFGLVPQLEAPSAGLQFGARVLTVPLTLVTTTQIMASR